jgi:MoaA/NifB/PqqE/SkfB family radical SAM enzyme
MNIEYLQRNLQKIILSPKNLFFRAINRTLKPRWLWFGVTDRCNSRCKHCDIWKQKPIEKPLTPREIEKAFSDPLFKDIEYVINSGGEAVLRSDLEEILLIEHKAFPKARLQLSTNGLLPDRVINVAQFALDHGINLDVGVSLDGIGEQHDFVRGVKGNFEKADKLLHELLMLKEQYKERLDITIGFTLSNLTLPFLNGVREYARKLNVNFSVQWYNESSYYENVGKSLCAKNEKMLEAVQSLPTTILRKMWIKWLKGKSIKFPCFAMYTFCVLKCDGNISPCLSLWHVNVGNIREKSPTEIWNSFKAREARKIVKNCQGCLNSWGTGWSFSSYALIPLFFYLKHPLLLFQKISNKNIRADRL